MTAVVPEDLPLTLETEWKQAIEGMPDMVSVHDRDFRTIQVNQAFAEFFSQPDHALVGRPCYEIYRGLSEPCMHCPHRKAVDRRQSITEEVDASEAGVPLRITAIPLLDDSDDVIGSILIARDISNERETEQKYRTLFHNSTDAIFVIALRDANGFGGFLDVNQVAIDRYGYTREEFLSLSPKDLAPPERRPELKGIADRQRHASDTVTFEWEHVAKDGSRIPVEIRSHQVLLHGRPVFLAVVRDITKRKAAEEAMAIRHEEVTSILSSVGDGVFGMDLQGRATYVNVAFEQQTGWREEEVIGKNTHQLLHHTRADGTPYPEEACPVTRTIAAGTLERIENDVFWRKDGTSFPVDYTSAAFRDRSGVLKGAVVVFRDITERKELEAQRLRHREELEREVAERTAELRAVNQELESFSYTVSHDLRGPLRTIDGYSQVMEEEYEDALDEEARGYLQRMRNAATRMTDLLDGLLVLSRVTRRELDNKEVDLSGLAAGIANDLSESAPERPVTWQLEPGLTACGDPSLLHVLLQNLFGNAWKFTKERAPAVIEFGRTGTERGEAFYVRDNGAGFDMRHSEGLFKPFQRLHQAGEFAGTGIGLATVQRIISRHGGQVWAESAPERGATFYFTLP
ncbi:MAG TPA: PAS domain S-box protein [Gammaproteobacteria bacterium]|nr:PAS domain S-box protein [Gammaproteobacteria bacterium]